MVITIVEQDLFNDLRRGICSLSEVQAIYRETVAIYGADDYDAKCIQRVITKYVSAVNNPF